MTRRADMRCSSSTAGCRRATAPFWRSAARAAISCVISPQPVPDAEIIGADYTLGALDYLGRRIADIPLLQST
ncbi:MAG: hypothetical protein WDN69_30095 [Aliidongia sp.]